MDLAERLDQPRAVVLDGAISSELERRGVAMSTETWSGAAAITDPDTVRTLHADYIDAGAEIITANTYAAGLPQLAAADLTERFREINERSVQLAREARESVASGPVWIAGSLSLMAPAFRSTRRGDSTEWADDVRRQAEVLTAAGCDLLILEMLRDIDYSARALDAALGCDLPVWAGFSVVVSADGTILTHPGLEQVTFEDCLREVSGRGEQLVGVMHSEIDDTAPGLAVAAACTDLPLGAWPNAGSFEPPSWQFVEISPDTFADRALAWIDSRVRVVGGCCGLGPEHIRAVAERLA